MCLAIPPNSTRSQHYSLPPRWCNYQEVVAAVKAEQQSSSLAAAEQATAAGRSQCVGPTTSRSYFGSVKSGYGMINHPNDASFVSNASSSPLFDLPPATPPPLPQSERYEFDFGLGLGGQMGLSPYIMQSCVNLNSNDSQIQNNATDNITVPMNMTAAPETFSDTTITSTLLNENNMHMMASQGNATHRRRRAPQRPGKTATQKERLFVQHNYHDLANESDAPEGVSSVENAAMEAAAKFDVSSSSSSSTSSHPFPIKLHQILEESEASGLGHIISWQPHGRAFKIHNPTLFTETIMQNYFPKMKKLASLQRQFNLYGFERLTREGPDAGAYYHEAFLRYRPGLSLARMIRKRVKGTGYKAASNPEAEPNLYAFPVMRDVTSCGSVPAAAGTTTFLPPSHFVTQKPARLSASSISSEGTTDLSSYYSTATASSSRSHESSSLQQQHLPYQVSSSSSSWSNPSMASGNVVQVPAQSPLSHTSTMVFPPPAPGGDNQMTTSASFSTDTSFMDRYLNLPQPAQDQMLQDALTVNDISSVDSFMEKYLREEASSLYQQGIDSSSYQQSWPELSGPPSSITMPSLQRQRSMGSWAPVLGKDSSLDSDVDGFMDRYLALPRATQDSILQDLLCVNEGVGDSSSTLNFDSF